MTERADHQVVGAFARRHGPGDLQLLPDDPHVRIEGERARVEHAPMRIAVRLQHEPAACLAPIEQPVGAVEVLEEEALRVGVRGARRWTPDRAATPDRDAGREHLDVGVRGHAGDKQQPAGRVDERQAVAVLPVPHVADRAVGRHGMRAAGPGDRERGANLLRRAGQPLLEGAPDAEAGEPGDEGTAAAGEVVRGAVEE
jgi:hypothetical protein